MKSSNPKKKRNSNAIAKSRGTLKNHTWSLCVVNPKVALCKFDWSHRQTQFIGFAFNRPLSFRTLIGICVSLLFATFASCRLSFCAKTFTATTLSPTASKLDGLSSAFWMINSSAKPCAGYIKGPVLWHLQKSPPSPSHRRSGTPPTMALHNYHDNRPSVCAPHNTSELRVITK